MVHLQQIAGGLGASHTPYPNWIAVRLCPGKPVVSSDAARRIVVMSNA